VTLPGYMQATFVLFTIKGMMTLML